MISLTLGFKDLEFIAPRYERCTAPVRREIPTRGAQQLLIYLLENP